jgi:hypothetical protein
MEDLGPNLKDYMEVRFNLLAEQLKQTEERFEERLREADLRYEQRFRAQMEAISKSDMAGEKRFESVNEFRSTLTDQAATFMPRAEAVSKLDSISDRVTKIEGVIYTGAGTLSGQKESKTDSRNEILLWISIIMMVVGVGAFLFNFLRAH